MTASAPEPVTARRAGLPLELDHVVGKALEKDTRMRYQSAADMSADLRRARWGRFSGDWSLPNTI